MADWSPRQAYPPFSGPEDDDDDDVDSSFTLEGGGRPFDQPLSPRQKLARGGLACALVVLTAFFVLGGPTAAEAFVQGLRHPDAVALSSVRTAPSSLAFLDPPSATAATPSLRISPAAGNRGDAYACWTDFRSPRAVHFAVLPNSRSRWTQLPAPSASGARCTLAADTLRETWVALAVYAPVSSNTATTPNSACALPQLFMSQTSGNSWQHIPWPNQWISACDVSVTLTDGHLYATASDPLLIRNALELGAPERIMTTDDAGKTWQVADVGLPFTSSVSLIGTRPDDHLLAETASDAQAAAGTLWESATNGAGWESLGQLPGINPVVEVSADPTATSEGGWGRLYVVAARSAGGAPGGQGAPLVETGFAGRGWSLVAPPPPQAGQDGTPGNQFAQAVAGPNDTLALMLEGPDLTRDDFSPPDYLWTWNPVRRTWRQAPFLIPENALFQGTTESGGQMRIWMTQINTGRARPRSVDIVTFSLTAAGAI
ncbi:MAG TPA: hypothetical protein VKT52_09355 [Ktedonobacterales bacterium]|nr:hypothetical protein [Ktedonobacterales bacterium]